MKICPKCHVFFQEQIMVCPSCQRALDEVSLKQALELTQQKSLQNQIQGKQRHELCDAYKQYHVRGYLKNRSLFLDFDLYKNRAKHGRSPSSFFIAPVNFSSVLNIPWFFFNIINSNLFHLSYTEFCPLCDSKYIKDRHTSQECDYNIEYFNILNDILSGRIIERRIIYEEYAQLRRQHGLHSAYQDLFCRRIRWEIFWDMLSVGFSVAFWIYAIVFVSLPWVKVMIAEMQRTSDAGMILMLR